MTMMLRPATPLTVAFLIAFVLLLLATLSTPIIQSIPLGQNGGYNFGVFGYCPINGTPGTCSSPQVGYPPCMFLYLVVLSSFADIITSRSQFSSAAGLHSHIWSKKDSLIYPHCPPNRCFYGLDLHHLGLRRPFPQAVTFTTLSTVPPHIYLPYSSGHPSGLPGRHLDLYPTSSMGYVDRITCHNHSHCLRCLHMRHEEDLGQQESAKEAYCRE